MKELRMHGIGGQGIVTGGEILSNAYLYTGKYMSVMPSYGVERRGSDVTAFGRVAEKPIREKSMTYEPDYLLIFDPSQIKKEATYRGFVHGGIIVACGTEPEEILKMGVQPSKIVMVDGIQIAFEVTGTNLTNMVMCGAFSKAVEDMPLDSVLKAIEENLPANFRKTSVMGAQRGYDEAKIYEYEIESRHREHIPQWERKCLACAAPEKPRYEAPWGNFDDHYMSINTGGWRVIRPVVDRNICVKCGICRGFCPTQCIEKDAEGYPDVDLGYCKGCGVCAHECTKKAITMKRESEFTE